MTADTLEGIVYGLEEAERISIGDGFTTLVDRADLELVSGYPWRALLGHNGKVYAFATTRSGNCYMHRLIARTPKGMETDHINGDGLDNRRCNLRVATASQNSANTSKPHRDARPHTSRFKGVSWSRHRSCWVAYIQVDQKTRNLGGFASEDEAANAYDAAALEAWGEFAHLNHTREAS